MPASRRVRKGTTDTLTTAFYDGGEKPVDKGAVTVTVTGELGTTLATGPATLDAAVYTFVLPAAATVALDRLTVTWVATTATTTSTVEVVGGFYFELAELRQMSNIQSTYNTERLRAARDWIENVIDGECESSFVRRYATDTFNPYSEPRHGHPLLLRTSYGQALLSVAVAGVQLTGPQLAELAIDKLTNEVMATSGYPYVTGASLITVRYEAGWSDTCPPDLSAVSLSAARSWLLATDGESGTPARARSITNQFGNMQLSTAGRDHPTGYDDVDAVIIAYRDAVRQGGIA
jgi:hypothetical protein